MLLFALGRTRVKKGEGEKEFSMVNNFEKNYLTDVMLKLSQARDVPTIIDIVRHASRILTGAEGATFVLKDKDKCYYVDEDAIAPLWKGKRFPLEACISGWSMINKKSVIIKDIFEDPRIPVEAYRPTFVKSLAMVPINVNRPIGAIGNYWAHLYEATEEELGILELIADCTAVALENVEKLNRLEKKLASDARLSCSEKSADELIDIINQELKITELLEDDIPDSVFERFSIEELKKSICHISLKQLNEMNRLFNNFLIQQ